MPIYVLFFMTTELFIVFLIQVVMSDSPEVLKQENKGVSPFYNVFINNNLDFKRVKRFSRRKKLFVNQRCSTIETLCVSDIFRNDSLYLYSRREDCKENVQ